MTGRLLAAGLTPFRWAPGLRGAGVVRRLALRRVRFLDVTTTRGLRMRVDIRDDMQWDIAVNGTWEEAETMALAPFLTPGAVFYDIGANIGYHSLIASRAVGGRGRVVAFEPVVHNRLALNTNIALNAADNVTVIDRGLSDRSETLTASFPRAESGMASIRSVALPAHQETIALQSGDDLVAAAALPAPTIVKLDVEGAEYKALLGLQATLQDARAVLVEITPPYLVELGASPEQLRHHLRESGFLESRVVSQIECTGDDGLAFQQTNELFVKPSRG